MILSSNKGLDVKVVPQQHLSGNEVNNGFFLMRYLHCSIPVTAIVGFEL